MDARRHNCAASPNSTLEDRAFIFLASFESGTTWEYSVNGPVVYKGVGGVKAWVVGDNQVCFRWNYWVLEQLYGTPCRVLRPSNRNVRTYSHPRQRLTFLPILG